MVGKVYMELSCILIKIYDIFSAKMERYEMFEGKIQQIITWMK